MSSIEAIQHVNIIRHNLPDDGTYPNNALHPLVIYKGAIRLSEKNPDREVKALLKTNNWHNAWTNGIYEYHHYHSITHEVLAVIQGSARVQFGGPSGVTLLVDKGDVIIIPAGVAHKAIELFDDFKVVGAYPSGMDYDVLTEKDNREKAIENIKSVKLPDRDPVYGEGGPLLSNWTH